MRKFKRVLGRLSEDILLKEERGMNCIKFCLKWSILLLDLVMWRLFGDFEKRSFYGW